MVVSEHQKLGRVKRRWLSDVIRKDMKEKRVQREAQE